MQRAKDNLVVYDYRMIAAAELNESYINAFYSETAIYSLPISINLLYNALIKHLLSPDYSISLSSQDLPHELPSNLQIGRKFGSELALLFALDMIAMLALFVIQPSRELITNFKQLQKMTGLSGITYWATMFLSDLMEYGIIVLLLIASLVCMDWILGNRVFGPTEICKFFQHYFFVFLNCPTTKIFLLPPVLEIFLLLLFGINALPIMYSFTFLKKNAVTLMPIAVLVPMMISTKNSYTMFVLHRYIFFFLQITFILVIFFGSPSYEVDSELTDDKQFSVNQAGLLPLLPYVSFFHTQLSFFITAHINAKCRRLPNEFYDLQCKQYHVRDVCCGEKIIFRKQ